MTTNLFSKIVTSEAERESSWIDQTRIAALVVFPVMIALLGAFTTTLGAIHWVVPTTAWLALLLLYGLFWRGAIPGSRSLLSIVLENAQLKEKVQSRDYYIQTLEESEARQSSKSLSAFSLRRMSIDYTRQGLSSLANLKEMLSDLLSPLYLTGGRLLGFRGTESWSFSVYLYSPTKDKLVSVWRQKSRNHPSGTQSREWGRGEGHVGKAFVDRETLYTADASDGDVLRLVEAKGPNQREYDARAYRSFASIPFGNASTDPSTFPLGVLVGTSNEKSRFDEETTELLKHYAETIGLVLTLTNFDLDAYIDVQDTGTEEK